jgi:hypothetical protein
MIRPFSDDDFAEYDRLCREAMINHRPDLEPYASMPIERIDALMKGTDKLIDLARYLMLENYLRDKMTPKEFLAHKMAKELSRWVLLEYAEEYPGLAEEGVLRHAAVAFALTVLRAIPEEPGTPMRLPTSG